MLPAGCRAFWREAQHKEDVPTCVIRGVLEDHTTPEALDMLSNSLTKQSGSALHDSQVRRPPGRKIQNIRFAPPRPAPVY
jgi:hypothetical protein